MATDEPTPFAILRWCLWRVAEGGVACDTPWCGRRRYAFMRYCKEHGHAILLGNPADPWRP